MSYELKIKKCKQLDTKQKTIACIDKINHVNHVAAPSTLQLAAMSFSICFLSSFVGSYIVLKLRRKSRGGYEYERNNYW